MEQSNGFEYLDPQQIYLDAACQTLRPQPVQDAMVDYFRTYNACGARVKYDWGRQVDAAVTATRKHMLEYVGKKPKHYVCAFTLNTTYGINLLLSQLPTADFTQLTTSDIEHNSVFVPGIEYAQRNGWVRNLLPRSPDGTLTYTRSQLEGAVVLVNTTSNIDGRPLANAHELARDSAKAGGITILDAAQTLAHNPEQLQKVDFDAACFSAHKMYGPSLGVIVIKKQLLERMDWRFLGGGTVEDVTANEYRLLRDDLASRLEPGLQDYAGIIGLDAALKWLDETRFGRQRIGDYVHTLTGQLYDGLEQIEGVNLINHAPEPTISFYAPKLDSHRLSTYLSAQNIMVRSGYFCCHYYLDHKRQLPPLLRLSIGAHTTPKQIEHSLSTIHTLLQGR